MRKVIDVKQDIRKETCPMLDEVQSHAFGLQALKSLRKLCKEDEKVNQRFHRLTVKHIQQFVSCVTKETKNKTLIIEGKYVSLKNALSGIEEITEVHIHADYCLRVDTDVKLPGTNLVVISPDMKIICPVSWDVSTC